MGVTKEAYFEICEALGSEPIPEEIPVAYQDLPSEVQVILGIYQNLKDEWDTMNGNYLGKNYSGILDIFTILEVPEEDWRLTFDIIGVIDEHRSAVLKRKADSKKNEKPPA